MARVEPTIHVKQSPKTIQQQAGNNQDNEGERNFRDDQSIVRAMLRPGIARSSAFLEAQREIAAAGLQCGAKSEQNSGEDRDGGREGEHRAVYAYFLESRQIGGPGNLQNRHSQVGKENSGGAPDKGKQHAFGKHLPNEAKTPGSQRSANGDLPSPGRVAGEQQTCNIGAGDQEYERDRTEQHK